MKLYIEKQAFKEFIGQLKNREIEFINYMMFIYTHLDVIYTFDFDNDLKKKI